jgi:glutamine cyclotransferase
MKHTLLSLLILFCAATVTAQKRYGYKVIATYPHDENAYTQGLFFLDGLLYESTGEYGKSTLRKVKPTSGEVVASRALDRRYFGEGIALCNGLVYQLTWREGECIVYDAATLAPQHTLRYAGEGWGLTTNGKQLIMSNGSNIIYFLSPQTLREERRIAVRTERGSVSRLNELELIDGEIWANVYTTNQIIRIDTATGQVRGTIDLTGILPASLRTRRTDVLNGIAYDAVQKRIFVTGKNWARMFEIKITDN